MCSPCRINSRRMISGNEPALQLSSPIEKLGQNQRTIARVVRFGRCLVIVVVPKAAEASQQPTRYRDQAWLRGAVGDHQAEPLLRGEGHTLFRLSLHELEG